MPDDATRILMLKAGRDDGSSSCPFSRAAELKATPNISMVLFPADKIVYLGMNIRPTLKDGTKNPSADKRLRQALNYGVEKKAIAQIVTYGMGTPQVTSTGLHTDGITDKGEPYPYNPDKAKALHEGGGFDNGVDLSIYALAGNADDTAEIAAIQQMWAQIGVRLKVLLVDSATRLAKYRADDFQMRPPSGRTTINDPSQIVSYMAYFPAYELNRSGFNDAGAQFVVRKEPGRDRSDEARRRCSVASRKSMSMPPRWSSCSITPYAVALDKQTCKASCSCRSGTICSSASIWSPPRQMMLRAGFIGGACSRSCRP